MYRSPEAFYLDVTIEGKPCDMWSFGIMTVEILTNFFLVDNLPPNDRDWFANIYPTLHEILQEHCFKWFFDMTFIQLRGSGDKDAKMALDFVHGFMKMDPSERTTFSEAGKHPFLTEGSAVRNEPDTIWKNEFSTAEFKKIYVSSFNGGEQGKFKEKGISKIDNDYFNKVLEDYDTLEKDINVKFGTQLLASWYSPVAIPMPLNSSSEMRSYSPSDIFTAIASSAADKFSGETNPHTMVDVLSEPQELKSYQDNHSKFISEKFVDIPKYGLNESASDYESSEAISEHLVNSEKTSALESTNKYEEIHLVPVSKKVRNLRLRIKELAGNSGKIEEKFAFIQKEEASICTNDPQEYINALKDNFENCPEYDSNDFSKNPKTESASGNSPIVIPMPLSSSSEVRIHSPSRSFTTIASSAADNFSGETNPQTIVDVMSEPQELKSYQGNHLKFISEEFFNDGKYGLNESASDHESSEAISRHLVNSEKTSGLESTSKYVEIHLVPVSKKVRNLRLRIKELVGNSGKMDEKFPFIQKEEGSICTNDPQEHINTLKGNFENCSKCNSNDFSKNSKTESQAYEIGAELKHSISKLDSNTISTKKYPAKDRVPVSKMVQNLRQKIQKLLEWSRVIDEKTKKDSVKAEASEFCTCVVFGKAAEKLKICNSSVNENLCTSIVQDDEIKDNQRNFSELSLELKLASGTENSLNKIDFECKSEDELPAGTDSNPIHDETKNEDILRDSKLNQKLKYLSDNGPDTHSKFLAEDFRAVSNPISKAAKLDSMISIIPPSKHMEGDENTAFESSDFSSGGMKVTILKIDLVDRKFAETKLMVDTNCTASLQVPRRRKSLTGWIRSILMFCCPCTTRKDI